MAVIGALRQGLDLTECSVYWGPMYSYDEYAVFDTTPVQGSLRLASGGVYLEVPVVWDADNAYITVEVDSAEVQVPLQQYCLENGFQFSVRPDGVVSFVMDENAPEESITIPILLNGEKLDSITFAVSALMNGSDTLTLDSNAEGGGGAGV